jgi:acyl-coenzyme A thioesterase PaaI-like protein
LNFSAKARHDRVLQDDNLHGGCLVAAMDVIDYGLQLGD